MGRARVGAEEDRHARRGSGGVVAGAGMKLATRGAAVIKSLVRYQPFVRRSARGVASTPDFEQFRRKCRRPSCYDQYLSGAVLGRTRTPIAVPKDSATPELPAGFSKGHTRTSYDCPRSFLPLCFSILLTAMCRATFLSTSLERM